MLASDFLKKLKLLTKEDVLDIKGIGDVLADNYIDFLDSSRYYKLIADFEALESQNINVEIVSKTPLTSTADLPLSNEIVCITGTFEISRNQIKDKLEEMGASVTDSVSSKTTILLAGESAGSKLEKAREFGVRIITDLKELNLE
jgi:DNA ligase (NAD+)